MKISDVKVVGKSLVRAKETDVAKLESALWISFPKGYREYVTKLGEGTLGGTFVRIYPPWRIAKELEEWRDRIRKHWFWDKAKKLLPKERALECVIVGDTVGGDELVFHPCRPERLFVLPAESEAIFEAGKTLLEAIDWMCGSGKLVEPFRERNFEPFDSRKLPRQTKQDDAPSDPPGESMEEIIAAAARWSKRHELSKWVKKNMGMPNLGIPESQLEISPLRQFVVFVPGKYESAGIGASFSLSDKKSKKEIGVSEMLQSGDSQSGQFTPHRGNWDALKKLYGDRTNDFDDADWDDEDDDD